MKQRNLTPKQEKFCHAYLATSNATTAYKEAYSTKNMKLKTITERASRLLREYNVSTMLVQLRGKIEDEGILTFTEIQKMLSDRAKEEMNGDGLKSIDILNKMAGNYEKDNNQKSENITFRMNLSPK